MSSSENLQRQSQWDEEEESNCQLTQQVIYESWHDSKVLLLSSIKVSTLNIIQWVWGRTIKNLNSSSQFVKKRKLIAEREITWNQFKIMLRLWDALSVFKLYF